MQKKLDPNTWNIIASELVDAEYWLKARPRFCAEISDLADRAQDVAGTPEHDRIYWDEEEAAQVLAHQATLTVKLSDEYTTIDQVIDSILSSVLFRFVTAQLPEVTLD